MTIEQFFKDKINWKVFNVILDACLELEDDEIWFNLDAAVLFSEKSHGINSEYKYLYRYYNVLDPTYMIIQQFKKEETFFNLYKKAYEKNGIFYTIYIDADDVKPHVIEKIKRCNLISTVETNEKSGYIQYVFKEY